MSNNNKFEYTYGALSESERREIDEIRKRYTVSSEQKSALERAKELDRRVRRFPTALALTLGIIGTLIFGLGLSLVLEFDMIALGILLASFALVPIIVSYPMYSLLLKINKAKYGEAILSLLAEKETKN